ncbi:hypothetical protein [Paraburkholderia agricolaris]|uniref:hypothetical protein n=1 Tax=Paraburkholderia agricolaris TaxID=2152888 RepID=UPI00129272AE|nr:hypothetical protein [Paraburkholderia agricolaris]
MGNADWATKSRKDDTDMVLVSRCATDSQLLEIAGNWIDLLAKQDYETVASALGYAVAYGEPPAECIRREIRQYRSSTFFPCVDDFRVTEKAQAIGGNPQPRKIVTRYKSNSTRLWATIDYDLPINGKWSDLCANFVIFETNEANPRLVLSLEDISSY